MDTGKKHLVIGLVFLSLVLLAGTGLALLSKKAILPPRAFLLIPGLESRPVLAIWAAVICLLLLIAGVVYLIQRVAPAVDMTLLAAALLLAEIGFIILLRLSPDLSAQTGKGAFAVLAWRQYNFLVVSLIGMVLVIRFLTESLVAILARRIYIYAVLAMLLVIFTGMFGTEIHGRKLWICIGPMTFQTVEVVKLLAVLFAAGYFTDRRAYMKTEYGDRPLRFSHPHVIGPFAVTALFLILPIVFQKDLGPALLLSLLMLLMYFLSGGGKAITLFGVLLIIGAGYLAYFLQWPSIVKTRFDMWLDPFHHSEALSRAMWAIASGGWFGTGLGEGMGYTIPVVQSDFNFIVICEEFGFIGGCIVIGLYGIILWRGFDIARNQDNVYKMLLAGGLTGLLGIQTILIICGNIGLLPLTGVTLPLVSYGGSSLLVSFAIVGILLKLSPCEIRFEPIL